MLLNFYCCIVAFLYIDVLHAMSVNEYLVYFQFSTMVMLQVSCTLLVCEFV